MNSKEYEDALAAAQGDQDIMLDFAMDRVEELEDMLRELLDTTNAMCPVDHPAFTRAKELL